MSFIVNHQVKVNIIVNTEPETSLGKRLAKNTPGKASPQSPTASRLSGCQRSPGPVVSPPYLEVAAIPCRSVFMSSVETRWRTFENNPDFQNGLITSKEVKRLASDGYFYALGRVQCFCCGLRQDLPHDANCQRKLMILNQARPEEPMDT